MAAVLVSRWGEEVEEEVEVRSMNREEGGGLRRGEKSLLAS